MTRDRGGRPAVQVAGLAVDRIDPARRHDGPVHALSDVSFTAPAGRVTALVGTNGAGKTTVLRSLVGALRPQRGRIEVLGSEVGPAEAACPAGVAVVPDAPVHPPDTTADDVVRLHRKLRDPFDVRGFGRRLRRHGIDPGAGISALSAGQATRAALAEALSLDPTLLLLDEPMARLDPLARREVLDELRDHLAGGQERSILLSTHDLDGMDRFVDHLVVLHAGRTVLEGDIDDLLEGHLIATVAADSDPPLAGARTVGPDGAMSEGLLDAETAVDLPRGAHLREPTLPELIGFTLAESTTVRSKARP